MVRKTKKATALISRTEQLKLERGPTEQVALIPTEKIHFMVLNPNVMDAETFQRLVDDLRKHGVQSMDPVLVRPLPNHEFEVVNGESRTKAALRLGARMVPGFVAKLTVDEAEVLCYRKNAERGTLDPLKEARLFDAERKKHRTAKQIAAKFGATKDYVVNRLKLLAITPEVVDFIPNGLRHQPSKLEALARIKDPQKQFDFVKSLVDFDNISQGKLREQVKEILGEAEAPRDEEEEEGLPLKGVTEKAKAYATCPLFELVESLHALVHEEHFDDPAVNNGICALHPTCDQLTLVLRGAVENLSKATRGI
jgi:ParB/RepB/Spo0J family partition protein